MGQLWTRLAAIYPPKLCEAYAKKIREAIDSRQLTFHDWRVREIRGELDPPEQFLVTGEALRGGIYLGKQNGLTRTTSMFTR